MGESLPGEAMVLSESEAIELLAFLVTSARIQLEEPLRYASMRILTAAEKLREAIAAKVSPAASAMLIATEAVTDKAHSSLADEQGYMSALDTLCGMVAQYLVESDELAAGSS